MPNAYNVATANPVSQKSVSLGKANFTAGQTSSGKSDNFGHGKVYKGERKKKIAGIVAHTLITIVCIILYRYD